jgi:multisubunit Na+/H+ antiporter MnhC subunit
MNKTIKIVLLFTGVILLVYGIYTLVMPETQISIGGLDLVTVPDNTNSYIVIGLGILAVALSLIKEKSS